MKHKSIWKGLQVKLVFYAGASLILALLTEGILALLLYLMSTVLGVSQGENPYLVEDMAQSSISGEMSEGPARILRLLENVGNDTLYTMLTVAVIGGLFLFVAYFIFLTGGITRDLSDIAGAITSVTGDVSDKRLPTDRQDEIGEIARSVNKMTEELTRLVDAEREAMQTNKEMIACLAHDLRTPLTSLIGYLNLVMDREAYEPEQRYHFAEIALQKADRLEGLISDLFDYTKLMSGEITLHRQRIDFVKLIEQMIEEFYPLLQENHLECHFDTEWRSLELELDPNLIARAVQNLLSNAVKYGKDGKQILINLKKDRGICFSVTNYGLTIPKESLELIFDRFYRVEESRSSSTGGTGLGLNIAKEIIELHGGSIEAESSLEGTVFCVLLPEKYRGGSEKE